MMKTDSRIQTLLTISCVLIGVGSTCIQPKQDNVLINLCCPTITEAEDNNTPGKFQIIHTNHQGGFSVYKVRKMGSKSMTVLRLIFNKIFY